MKVYFLPVFMLLVFFLNITVYGQEKGSVGIGIEDPNPNAILHLVSPGNNQGLLIPALTTTQRTASSFVGNLSSVDNGLLIYDLDDKVFYYWKDTQWVSLSAGTQSLSYNQVTKELSISGGNTINIGNLATVNWDDIQNIPDELADGDDTDDADADPANEIQDLEVSGTVLKITNNENATGIDLGALVGSANQGLSFEGGILSLSGDPNGAIVDLSGYDSDVTDDFDGQFSSLSGIPAGLSDGDDVDDADADPTNELQVLSTNGTPGNISLSGSGTLQLNVNDLDPDPTNENQTVSAGTGITINRNDQDFQVVNAMPDQPVTLTDGGSGNVTIGGTYPDFTVDVPSLDDADADATNELLTDALLDGTMLNLTDAGGTTSVDLSSLVDDADADPENEIQNLELVGNILSLSNDATPVDLSAYLDDKDEQDLSLTGNTLSLTNDGTPVDLTGYLDNTDNQNLSFDGINLNITGGTGINISAWDTDAGDDFDGNWSSLSNRPAGLDDGDDVDDADADPTNELQIVSLVDDTVTLSKGGGSFSINDADADPGNELQSLELTSNVLTLTNDPTLFSLDFNAWDRNAADDFNGSWTDLAEVPADFADGVDDVDDADADPNNEIQNLAYNITTNELTIRTGSTPNNSVFLTDLKEWSVLLGVASYDGNYAKANNFISTPIMIQQSDITSQALTSEKINFSRVIAVNMITNVTLSNIADGENGQELTLIVIGDGTLTINDGGNLHLSTLSYSLKNGDNISFIYYTFTVGSTTYNGWTETSHTISN